MTTVRQLINKLEAYAKEHGENSKIGVYSFWDQYKTGPWGSSYEKVCRKEIYIDDKGVLTSRGDIDAL